MQGLPDRQGKMCRLCLTEGGEGCLKGLLKEQEEVVATGSGEGSAGFA